MVLARSVSYVTLINIFSAMISVLNISAMAYYFGTSESIEIYFASTLLLTTFLTISNSAQIPDIVLPVYHKVCSQYSVGRGQKAFSVILNWYLVLTILIITCMYAVLDHAIELVVPGFSEQAKAEVQKAVIWILPLMFFSILVQFFVTYINAESQFGRPELIALGVKIVALVTLVLLASSYSYWALVIGLWLGMLFRITSYIFLLRRQKFSWKLSFSDESIEGKSILKRFFSSFGYAFSSQLFVVALNSGISQLPQGTFAIYNYINQLVSKTNGIFLRPISLVFFTKVSQAIASNIGGLKSLTREALGLFLLSALPIILFVFFYGEPGLQLLLGLGEISPHKIEIASNLLQLFFSLLLFTGLTNVCRKVLLSTGWAEYLNWSTSCLQIVCAVFAYLILPKYGYYGMFLVIGIQPILVTLWIMWSTKSKLDLWLFYEPTTILKWSYALLATAVCSYIANRYLLPYSAGFNRVELFSWLCLHGIGYLSILYAAAYLAKVAEVVRFTDKAISLIKK